MSNFRDYWHDLQKGFGKACRWEEVLETREIKNYAIEKSDLNGGVSMESIEP